MTYIPRNSSPLNNKQGWQDNSVPELVRQAIGDPIHKPLIFTFGGRCVDNEAFPLSGDNLLSLIGRDVVDYRSKYATFNTPFLNMFNANGNEMMVQVVRPDDAKVAMQRMAAEVLLTDVEIYERNTDGSIKYDATGQAMVKETRPGMQIVFRVMEINDANGLFKNGKQMQGTLTGTGGEKSMIIPLWDIKGPYASSDVNGFGYKLTVPTAKSSPALSAAYQQKVGGRVYTLQWFETLAGVSSPVIWKTLKGMTTLNFSFKPDAYYEPMATDLDFDSIVTPAWRNTIPEIGALPDYGPFEEFYVYHANLKALLEQVAGLIDNAPADPYLIDIFNGLDLNGNPYDGLIVNPGTVTGKATFSSQHVHYLSGGSDGTLNNDVFDELVRREMSLFPEDGKVRYDNELKYSLGCFWDAGFSFETKEVLCNFIGRSRNTFLGLCTHVYNEGRNDLQAEESAKVALMEMVSAVPESDKFGTPAARGLIMGQTGKIRNSSYKEAVPLIYSIANFFSKYMGAKDGYCKPEYRFNRGSKTIIEDVTDVSMPWKGNEVYASDWDVSLISARSYDYYRVFIPAIQSIYPEERSVLNNALFNFLMTYVYRVTDRVWADTTGLSGMTRAEAAKDIENNIIARLANRLDGNANVIPTARFTDEDISNGNSVTVDLRCEGGTLLTQFNTTIRVYRQE